MQLLIFKIRSEDAISMKKYISATRFLFLQAFILTACDPSYPAIGASWLQRSLYLARQETTRFSARERSNRNNNVRGRRGIAEILKTVPAGTGLRPRGVNRALNRADYSGTFKANETRRA